MISSNVLLNLLSLNEYNDIKGINDIPLKGSLIWTIIISHQHVSMKNKE